MPSERSKTPKTTYCMIPCMKCPEQVSPQRQNTDWWLLGSGGNEDKMINEY